MVQEYQFRKWFGLWRKNYLIKAQNNYFMPEQQPDPRASLAKPIRPYKYKKPDVMATSV